jgi:hypothetical protein
MSSQTLAVGDACAGPEFPRQSPQIQPLIQFPRNVCNNARAVGAHVFRKALLGRMTNIQTAEIDSNCQGNTLFQPVGGNLHRTPRCLVTKSGLMGVGEGAT